MLVGGARIARQSGGQPRNRFFYQVARAMRKQALLMAFWLNTQMEVNVMGDKAPKNAQKKKQQKTVDKTKKEVK
jgi:hypothetical protein